MWILWKLWAVWELIGKMRGREKTKKTPEVKEETVQALAKNLYLTKEEANQLALKRKVYDAAMKCAKVMDRSWLEAILGLVRYWWGDIIPAVISSAYLIHLWRKIWLKSEDYGKILVSQAADVWIWLVPIVWNFVDFRWKSSSQAADIFKDCVEEMELEMMKRWNPEEDIQQVERESERVVKEINSYVDGMSIRWKTPNKIKNIQSGQKLLEDIEKIINDMKKMWGLHEDLSTLETKVDEISTRLKQIIDVMIQTWDIDDANELKGIEQILEKIRWIIKKPGKWWDTEKKGDTTALEDIEDKLSSIGKGLRRRWKGWLKRKLTK